MSKTDHNNNTNVGQAPREGAVNARDSGEQVQLPIFETVMSSPTMTAESSLPAAAEPVHVDSPRTAADDVEASASNGIACDETAAATQAADLAGTQELPCADAHAAMAGQCDVDAEADADGSATATHDHAQEDAYEPPALLGESLGQRLRAAREARGLRCEEAAHQMKLPLATVQALEADCYDRIGDGIYLRSYLSKYLRVLDLPQVLADRVLNQRPEPPPLITSGTVSRPRYLFERYSASALYLILTAVIIVPAVWLAMRAGFETNLAQITPLDTPGTALPLPAPGTTAASKPQSAPDNDKPAKSAASDAQGADEQPMVASLLPAMTHDTASTEKHEASGADVADKTALRAGEHSLRLVLAESSWVEIVTPDGEKLEFGLLPAGTAHTYHSAKPIDVRVGNANGATIEIDGKARDLSPFRHANVAHF
jgi:cytoskeleton protein RodZ